MGRVFGSYGPANRNGDAATVSVTSTGGSDVKTVIPPPTATACLLSCETTDGRFTCDGTTAPGPAAGHLLKSAASAPLFLPVAVALKWVSTAGTQSVLQVTWLE